MRAWWALGAFVVLGSCGEPATPPKDFNHYEFASHCLNALHAATETKAVSPETAALSFPWRITKVAGTDDLPTLECSITEGDKYRFLTVKMVCRDGDREECSRLIDVSDYRRDR